MKSKFIHHLERRQNNLPVWALTKLFYEEYESLQVLTLGMVDIYRVVCRLAGLVKYAYITTGVGGGHEDRAAEVIAADDLRAGVCEQQTAGTHLLDGQCVEPAVALQCLVEGGLVFCEGGRIKNYEIIFALHPG